jgi:hypothetical protein
MADTQVAGHVTRQNRKVQFIDSIKKALFVIGSPLLIFIAFRNSVVWYVRYIKVNLIKIRIFFLAIHSHLTKSCIG